MDSSMYELIKELAPTAQLGRTAFELPEGHASWSDYFDWQSEHSKRRHSFTARMSWAIPSLDAIQAIAEFVGQDSVLEIGAGSGLWAYLLHDAGLEVIATDNHSRNDTAQGIWYHTERIKHTTAIRHYPTCNVLMLCWPNYNDHMASASLHAFKGSKVVYIGEGEGGCTGDKNFHKALQRDFTHTLVEIPQWPGLHDYVTLATRSQPSEA